MARTAPLCHTRMLWCLFLMMILAVDLNFVRCDVVPREITAANQNMNRGQTQSRDLHPILRFRRSGQPSEPKKPMTPRIVEQPLRDVFFIRYVQIRLPCNATGTPSPMYRWTKNGRTMNLEEFEGRIKLLNGTLVIQNALERDEGHYQCLARNQFGVSVSTVTRLRQAKAAPFPQTTPQTHRAQLGQPLTIPCNPPASVPEAKISWFTEDNNQYRGELYVYDDFTPDRIDFEKTSPRVSVDQEGDLRITNLKSEDERFQYYCAAMNVITRTQMTGESHLITGTGYERPRPPVLMYSSPADALAISGKSVRLQCIFSGNPTPEHGWERVDFPTLPENARILNGGQVLEFDRVAPGDAGKYRCVGKNNASDATSNQEIHLRVEMSPQFVERPKDTVLGIGGTAEFSCQAEGIPTPNIVWTVNAFDLKDRSLRGKRFTQPSKNQLVVPKVSGGDSMVIQCNASNTHGYVFTEASLNVRASLPINVKAVWDRKAKRLNVTWEGPTNGLQVLVCGKQSGCRSVTGGTNQQIIPRLRPGRSYTVSLKAETGEVTDPVTIRLPRRVTRHLLKTVVFKSKDEEDGSMCLVPSRLEGRFKLIQAKSNPDVLVSLLLENSRKKKSATPKEIRLSTSYRALRFYFSTWEIETPHRDFHVESTDDTFLVKYPPGYTLTVTRRQVKRLMLYDVEIDVDSYTDFKGMIDNLRRLKKRRKLGKKMPKHCRRLGASSYMYIGPNKARSYLTDLWGKPLR